MFEKRSKKRIPVIVDTGVQVFHSGVTRDFKDQKALIHLLDCQTWQLFGPGVSIKQTKGFEFHGATEELPGANKIRDLNSTSQ
jgi:hypothetical protein